MDIRPSRRRTHDQRTDQYIRTNLHRSSSGAPVSLLLIGALRDQRRPLRLPLASSTVTAGFPSPADDYIDVGIDLNEALIRHPSSTFFLRVSGDSMIEAGIQHGDLLVVDRSLEARPGQIVVAVLDGAFTLKRLARHQGRLRLEAANSAYPPLELHRCGDVQIWGVAIHVIHSLGRHG